MRASPIGWYGNSIDEVLSEAKKSAEVSHNHPEGIKGAQAAALAVYLARTGKSKDEIKKYIVERFEYDLDRTIDEIRPTYEFDVRCQGSVPEAIIAFLESTDFENAIRLAVSIGGDSDTIACITGGIAEAFYKEIPLDITDFVSVILGPDLMLDVVMPFSRKYGK
jgi:ADP-ribosylglycohydrolase